MAKSLGQGEKGDPQFVVHSEMSEKTAAHKSDELNER
ncbi:DUF2945 domain-containing protein [Chelatococcus reniformis]|nr:DUF2945 domain-containing protein [Chelatococcus reniformis]